MKKLYRTIITTVVLSDEPLSDGLSLGDIHKEIIDCLWVLHTYRVEVQEIGPGLMEALLEETGSDPEFFGKEK